MAMRKLQWNRNKHKIFLYSAYNSIRYLFLERGQLYGRCQVALRAGCPQPLPYPVQPLNAAIEGSFGVIVSRASSAAACFRAVEVLH
jgi:hypothetical protein